MTRITRRTDDPFVGKEDYSNMGRSIASYRLVHRNADLQSKWRPRYESSCASQSPARIGHEIGTITRFKPKNASPSRTAAILTHSDTYGDVELSEQKQHENGQRKRSRHRKRKLRLSQSNAPKSQSTTGAAIPKNTINASQKIEPGESRLSQQRTAVRNRVGDGEHKMDLWQQALAKAAKAAEDGPVCYHLLLEQLDIDRARGY